ncbi:MAG TPA: nuclear transport factor 2 family protein [Pyrinomonadaceae bacterium]|jgi:ketosteroid isomerase-like protein|nr:nuclear transport factor 2 family protein [Pyrinomonadaceae bacterium]
MKLIILTAFAILLFAVGAPAQTAPDAPELTRLLNEFLAGASRDDAAIHDKFWAPELVYTGSAGARRGKAEIMSGFKGAPTSKPGDPKTTFTSEDIRIQQYGNTAIVAFRLVGTTVDDGITTVAKFFNTGTFLKRKGTWQAVAWQATRIPVSEEDAKKEVAAAEAAFHRALLAGDVKTLGRLTDESFVWMHHDGEQNSRQKLLEDITSGELKYAKLETDKITVSVTGDTAIVRGVSNRQRVNGNPLTTFYTLTFVNRGGLWKAISLHTSRR